MRPGRQDFFLTASLVIPKWNQGWELLAGGLVTRSMVCGLAVSTSSGSSSLMQNLLQSFQMMIWRATAPSWFLCTFKCENPWLECPAAPPVRDRTPNLEHRTKYWCQVRLDGPQETDLPPHEPFLGVNSTPGLGSLPFLTNPFSTCLLGSPNSFQWQGYKGLGSNPILKLEASGTGCSLCFGMSRPDGLTSWCFAWSTWQSLPHPDPRGWK